MGGEEKAVDSVWQWYPNEGLGPVRFGDRVEAHMFRLHLRRTENSIDGDDERAWYDVPGGEVSLQSVNGVIVGASCDHLVYRGRDLAGMSAGEVTMLFGASEARWGVYPADTSMFVDSLGCILTFDSRDGTVAAVAVSRAELTAGNVEDTRPRNAEP